MAAQPRDLLSDLGSRLRERRLELDLTLSAVAKRAELSISHLGAIEAGGSVPSLPVLARIAHALGLSLYAVLRGAAAPPVATGRLAAAPGVHPTSAEHLELDVVTLVARAGEAGSAPVADGAVFVHVRSGSLELAVHGEIHLLHDGDSLQAHVPPGWRSPAPSVSIWAVRRPR